MSHDPNGTNNISSLFYYKKLNYFNAICIGTFSPKGFFHASYHTAHIHRQPLELHKATMFQENLMKTHGCHRQ